jgi:hypothetical protein
MRWGLWGLMKKPSNGKVYTVPEETNSLVAGKKAGERKLSKAFVDQMFKPGQSGNPAGGRKKGLSDEVRKFLTKKVPNDPQGRMYLEKLVESMVKRAIKKSDVLMKEIFDRVEGKVPNDPAEAAQYGVKIIIADIPGPPGEFNQFIDENGKTQKKVLALSYKNL